jgi:hypothetical protein
MRKLSVTADLAAVVVFVAIGRSVHAHGLSPAGLVSTTWPFAAGLAAGWIMLAARHRDGASLGDGAAVVALTVSLGLILRVVSGQGTAFAFVLVASAFLGATMVGWRLVLATLASRHPAGIPPGNPGAK